ncbi:hypothetical protein E0686_03555 [Deinococcus sp. S9]|nr:hypothetical protein E0686_03555 [Deinococcus sp. S9]
MPAFSLPRRKPSVLMLAALAPLASLAAAQIRPQSIVVNPSGPAVTSLTLINADTNRPVPGYDPIPPAATLDLSKLPARLNLRANTAGPVGSIRFGLDSKSSYRVENVAPYALCGNNGGAYVACPSSVFSPGHHSVSAAAYTGANASGTAGSGVLVNFNVVRGNTAGGGRPPVTIYSLTLIDADSGRPVPGYDPIPAGARLKLSALPRHLNVRANVAPGVGRVRFVWENGQTRLELGVPFTLCGDQPDRKTRKDHYFACDPGVFSPGEHRITVTPYATWSPNVSGPALIWVFSVER